jgi:hypothetical protein
VGPTLDRDVPTISTLDQIIAESAFEQHQGQDPLVLMTTAAYPKAPSMPPGAMPAALPPGPSYMPRSATKPPPSGRKRWLAVGMAVAGTGLLSFAIAAAALNRGDQASSGMSPDAAPVDAGAGALEQIELHDAGAMPDGAQPALQDKVTPPKKTTTKKTTTKKNTTKKNPTKKNPTKKTTTKKTTTKKTTTKKTTTTKTTR